MLENDVIETLESYRKTELLKRGPTFDQGRENGRARQNGMNIFSIFPQDIRKNDLSSAFGLFANLSPLVVLNHGLAVGNITLFKCPLS